MSALRMVDRRWAITRVVRPSRAWTLSWQHILQVHNSSVCTQVWVYSFKWSRTDLVQGSLYRGLALSVKGRCSFIQQQYTRVTHQCTSNSNSLFLASTQLCTTLSYHRLEFLQPPHNTYLNTPLKIVTLNDLFTKIIIQFQNLPEAVSE